MYTDKGQKLKSLSEVKVVFKVAVFHYQPDKPSLFIRDLQKYFDGSAELLYGCDDRDSVSTLPPELCKTMKAIFSRFSESLIGRSSFYTKLLIFDSNANTSLLLLKYFEQLVCYFKVDQSSARELFLLTSNHYQVKSLKEQLRCDLRTRREHLSELIDESEDVLLNVAEMKELEEIIALKQEFVTDLILIQTSIEEKAGKILTSGWD